MNNLFYFLLFFTLPIYNISAQNKNTYSSYESKTIIVKLKKEYATFFNKKTKLIISSVKINDVKPASLQGVREKTNSLSQIYQLSIENNISTINTCKILLKSKYFEYCEPNYTAQILYEPNDNRISEQYTLSITHTFEAWEKCKGDSNIVIGITDTGIDFDHKELKKKVKYNYNDPIDGVDNDHDGYIDNFMGWDFGCMDNNPQWNESDSPNNMIHGIFVSGLAGAFTDNENGIAAIGFSNKILPIKVLNDEGYIYNNNAYAGILYAAEHGCKIINCSWGSTNYSQFGADIIKYVTEELGVLIVAAAGNDNNKALFYPASYPNVLSVAASNSTDKKWTNSSYNWRVDISAPGEDVLSTRNGNGYTHSSGTSFSAPITASAAALAMAYYKDTLSALQITALLKASADNIDTVSGNELYTHLLGKGRLNTNNMLNPKLPVFRAISNFDLLKNGTKAKSNDTAYISAKLTNFLNIDSNLTIKIKSLSPWAEVLDSTLKIAHINTLESIKLFDYNLRVKISSDTPIDTNISLLFSYCSPLDSSSEIRSTSINPSFINLETQSIKTTFNSTGNIGFSIFDNKKVGYGFILDSTQNILSEFGIVCGNSTNEIWSNVVNSNDFSCLSPIDSFSTTEYWEAKTSFKQNTNIEIKATYRIYKKAPLNKTILCSYKIINHSFFDYNNFFFSLYADWDIPLSDYNYSDIDQALRIASVHTYQSKTLASIQLLDNHNWNRFALAHNQIEDSINTSDGISKKEWYYLLSHNKYYEGLKGNGKDISDIVSKGSFILLSNDTINLSFAITADTSYSNILSSALAAQEWYDKLHLNSNEIKQKTDIKIFPNPNNGQFYIKHTLKGEFDLSIFNTTGTICFKKKYPAHTETFNTALKKGAYFIVLKNEKGKPFIKKIIIE